MRCVCRPEPKFLAVSPSLNARCLSARTGIPGDISQFECEAFLGRNQNSWHYVPIWIRGAFWSEPKFLVIFTNLDARRFSVRTEIPGVISQFECEVFVGQSQYSWRYFPVLIRGVFRSGPKFPAVCASLGARRYSVRTEMPGGVFQCECEVGTKSSWRYVPIRIRIVFRPEPKLLAVFSSLDEERFSVRTEIPGDIFQFEREVLLGRNLNSWRYFPV